jgi:ABC-type Zn uptake system ZnuABC Zn-binding protein ZnuA
MSSRSQSPSSSGGPPAAAKLGCLVLAAAIVLWPSGCQNRRETPAGGKLPVVASIFPLADVARQIGGEHVDVTMLLPPGVSPHGFTARPQDAQRVRAARLVIMVGMGIDQFAQQPADAAAAGGAKVLVLTDGAEFRRMIEPLRAGGVATQPQSAAHEDGDADHDEHEHAGHGVPGQDPHVWLDPVYMQTFASDIAQQLSQLDPANAADYRRRGAEFIAQLRHLDDDYRAALGPLKNRTFITFHAAFTYLAARYNLRQMSLMDVDAGGLSPQQMELVHQAIHQHGVKAVFVEPQFPAEKLQSLVRNADVRLGTLDPEGNPTTPGYDSYLAMMRSNLRSLVLGLGQ